jgi:DNA modification methylase
MHLDWYVGHHVRPILDEVFGSESSLGEVVWAYGSPSGGRVSGSKLVKAHDFIYIYAREYGSHRYKIYYLPYSEKYINDWFKWEDESGRRYRKRQRRDKEGKTYWEIQYLDESPGVPASTVWSDIQQVYADPRAYKAGTSSEITGFPTQKPERLLERIIEISTERGDLVADFFAGSGTTMAVAEKLGRRWIGCDLGRYAIHVSRKRLLDIENCRPFEVLNLGKYERRYWKVATFGEDIDDDGVISLYEYVAFILKLYGAAPTTGLQHLHGKLGTAFVHVGAVDAPVTLDEVAACVEECATLKGGEVHVLGWEWEMGMNDLVSEEAKRRGVKVVLRQIPREVMEEQAATKGDVRFFELAYLEASVEPTGNAREFTVGLENFVIPNPELVSDEMREKITKWSDYVDYWAVDWDFRDDTFMQGWVTYRTRKNRKLELRSNPHAYEEPGEYAVMVKVIDVFGNDTSTILRVTVS